MRKKPNAEPIAGYRLIELLGKGGCGEVWKCEAPGGLFKAIKFVNGNLNNANDDRAAIEDELRAIEHIKSIRHPFLLSMDRVECTGGELLIVTELADRSLHQLLEEYRKGGHCGIPRQQVLEFLRETAEVLDLINFQHGLQHLDVKPRNLFLLYNHVKVGDFGLLQSRVGTENSSGIDAELGAVTPLYASPELFRGVLSPHCDQYSLAITYQELLTGTLPFQGENARQLLLMHTEAEPDLESLPAEDRPIITRALSKDPEHRFPNCMELVDALLACAVANPIANGAAVDHQQKNVGSEANPKIDETLPLSARPEAETDHKLGVTMSREAATNSQCKNPVFVGPFRLIESLGKTPLVENWLAEAPDGQKRLLKYVYGFATRGKEQEEALLKLRSLQHPLLNRLEVVEKSPGRVAVVTDRINRTLRDEFRECRRKKMKGLPRAELLDILHIAAEGLDYLYRQHSMQHLNLHPQCFILDKGRVLLDEFGLFQLFWMTSEASSMYRKKRYSAPELLLGKFSPKSDQYSLAAIYVEMLTGRLPEFRRVRNSTVEPCLDFLAEEDRAAVERALDPAPNNRWSSCVAFMDALEGQQSDASQFSGFEAEQFDSVIQNGHRNAESVDKEEAIETGLMIKQIVEGLTITDGGGAADCEDGGPPAYCEDSRVLHHQFVAGLPLGDARLKLDALREQFFGHLVEDNADRYVFHIDMPRNFLQKWIGLQPGLRVAVSLARQQPLTPNPIIVKTEVTPYQFADKRGETLMKEMGTDLIEQLRATLLISSDKRIHDRVIWSEPIEVCPVLEDGVIGEPIACKAKDLSMSGIGFYLPEVLETSEVLITLPATDHTEPVSIPSTLVRAKPCADGQYEVGALFKVAVFRNTHQELVLPVMD